MKTFQEWRDACYRNYLELYNVGRQYLNDEGQSRMNTFYHLWEISNFFSSATEMLKFIEDSVYLSDSQKKAIQSSHAGAPLHRLNNLALLESRLQGGISIG